MQHIAVCAISAQFHMQSISKYAMILYNNTKITNNGQKSNLKKVETDDNESDYEEFNH